MQQRSLVFAVVGMALAACSKDPPAESAKPAPGSSEVGASEVAAKAEPAEKTPEAAQASYEEASFKLALQAPGTYKAGEQGEAQVVLEPGSGFKVNEEYPFKFKLKPSEGVKYVAEPDKNQVQVVGKDQMEIDKKRGVMKVLFTPEAAGDKTVAGTFMFSVCTEDKCLIERRELSLDIPVN